MLGESFYLLFMFVNVVGVVGRCWVQSVFLYVCSDSKNIVIFDF